MKSQISKALGIDGFRIDILKKHVCGEYEKRLQIFISSSTRDFDKSASIVHENHWTF